MEDDKSKKTSKHSFSASPLSPDELNQLKRTEEQQINILNQVDKQSAVLKGPSWKVFREKIRNKCETEPWWKIRKVITDKNPAISDMIKQFLHDEKLNLKDLNVNYITLYRITEDCLKEESKTIKNNLDRLEKENSKQVKFTKFLNPRLSKRNTTQESFTKQAPKKRWGLKKQKKSR